MGKKTGMEIKIPLPEGLYLHINDTPDPDGGYPSSMLQKAFLLIHNGRILAQESVGFGFPLVKLGLKAIFPGNVELSSRQRGPDWDVSAVYTLNVTEKTTRPGRGSIRREFFYTLKNFAALLIRRVPAFRGILTAASSALRRMFSWETAYERTGFQMKVKMTYTINTQTGTMLIRADWADQVCGKATEFVIMNEQGAHYFDRYHDSSGTVLQGKEIGCWDEVFAHEATFMNCQDRIGFSLETVSGTRLFRGRELIGSRLAWAGFGYSLPPGVKSFSYVLRITKCP
jgi:hypothetical protein